MSRYILTAEAQQDLREIRDYLTTEGGPRVARYIASAFTTAFRQLANRPGIGHRREDLTPLEYLRFWPIFSYLIVYWHGAKPLTVVAVLHGSRNVAKVLQQRPL
jgi:toxin ParE1/3/4